MEKKTKDPEFEREYRIFTGGRMARMHHAGAHHMDIPWRELTLEGQDVPAVEAPFKNKAIIAGRVGVLELSGGASAWRVRDCMNIVCRALGISCTVDIGLVTINCTFYNDADRSESFTQSVTLPTTGINTNRLMLLSNFVHNFALMADSHSIVWFNQVLDRIMAEKPHYTTFQLGLASGSACAAFTFLLGGGVPEMICAFCGAFVGNFIKTAMTRKKLSLFMSVIVGVAMACITYVCAIRIGEVLFHLDEAHRAGYICAMLFIIPGFPLITGGVDIAKVEMRSGLERMSYAFMIIIISTMVGWVTADILHFQPGDFVPLGLSTPVLLILRLIMSFIGVYGFSMMYDSPARMCAAAGLVGMVANTARLFIAPHTSGFLAALIGATIAGLLAAYGRKRTGFPYISMNIPAIVIMVPGLYLYRGIYNIGINNFEEASRWLCNGMLIIIALPLGIVIARFITDRNFRVVS